MPKIMSTNFYQKVKLTYQKLNYFIKVFSTRGNLIKRVTRLRKLAKQMLCLNLYPSLPVRLQIETTDTCNFKCIMCARENLDGMNTTSMSLQQFSQLIDAIDPYYVTLNGLGEPLIDKTIFQKLDYLHLKNIFTSMPSNGSLIRGEKLSLLAKSLPDSLCFSIDGATKESFENTRKASDFEKVLENYKSILNLKIEGKTRKGTKIHILCALQKNNLFDFKKMYQLVQEFEGIDNFSLVPFFNYGEDINIEKLVPIDSEIHTLHKKLEEEIAATEDQDEKNFYQSWKRTSSQWLSENSQATFDPAKNYHACLVPWFSSYIDAKGKVYPCCYLLTTQHVMGNINEQSFEDIWSGNQYKTFRQNLTNDRCNVEGCRTCPRNDDSTLQTIKQLKLFI